ncbi:MAG: adenosylcobinamide-GDP ribazoletransferase [Hyphomicrobium sp.]
MIAREARLILVAMQFLTRIPVRPIAGFEPIWLDRSVKYFPLIGAGVGAIAAGVLLMAAHIWPLTIAVVLAMAAATAVTGALHEDGLADTADAFGGGASPEASLVIMKDSRIGTFGVVALILVMALKGVSLMAMTPAEAAAALVAGHALSRLAAALVIGRLAYAGDAERAKVRPLTSGLGKDEALVAVALGLLPGLMVLQTGAFLAATALAGAAAGLLAAYSHRRIGGYTGDVLGAVEQVTGAAFLLALAAF